MTRRGALRVVLACCLSAIGIGSAVAQDPRATTAQKEARRWLDLTDHGDAAASWGDAGKKLQTAITAARWPAALNDVRRSGGRIVAVGSTSLRLLECASADDGAVHPFMGETVLEAARPVCRGARPRSPAEFCPA